MSNKHAELKNFSANAFYWPFFVILALVPFHGFLTTWIASFTGNLLLVRSWKEILLFAIGIFITSVFVQDAKLRQKIFSRTVNKLIILYAAVHTIWVLILRPDTDAAIAGIMINLRFLAFFVLAQIVIYYFNPAKVQATATKIIFITSFVVVLFGMLQFFVLPADFLGHFGYNEQTTPPFYTIDQNPDFIRINSLTRGPNPLGVYLILPITMLAAWLIKKKSWQYGLILVPYMFTLYGSHSRSAWLGAAISVFILVFFFIKKKVIRYSLIGLVVFGLLLLPLLISVSQNSYYLQHVVLHSDQTEFLEQDSNIDHFRASRDAAEDVLSDPLGDGPGTAGPASAHNDQQTRYAENYYLQIGQEVGIVGLALFIAINWLVIKNLWLQRQKVWPKVLIASFVGITVVNFFLHGWANEEIALLWWGIAGLHYTNK